MRFSVAKLVILALAGTEVAVANSWFPGSKTVYNKWHETELERWLSDHDVPYPAASDRKDLESLIKNNWQAKVVDSLSAAGDKADYGYSSVKDYIFDSWTESSLKAFLDHNKIPNPQPRTRDSLLTSARQNYDGIAKKLNQYTAYPGDWLYQSWSESDLKEYLDSRGIPAPQPSTRDRLVASVRRNSRLASLSMKSAASSASSAAAVASKSAASAQASLSDALFDSWSDSKLKEYLDEYGVPVPQGSKKNEMIALARKQRAKLTGNAASSASASGNSVYGQASSSGASAYGQASSSGSSAYGVASSSGASAYDAASASAASAYGAASSNAGNTWTKATDAASAKVEEAFGDAVNTWSDSRLKAYLDARGVPVPQGGKRDELLASVRLNAHKASTGWSAWTFDTWTTENLKSYLEANGKKVKKSANANRDQLLKQAQEAYATASKSGGTGYASVTSYLAKQTDAAKALSFDTWSDSDLKDYLDSYGVPNYQGSTTNELRAAAKKNANYFRYGTSTPQGTLFESIKSNLAWLYNQAIGAANSGSASASSAASSAATYASKQGTSVASQAAAKTASIKAEL